MLLAMIQFENLSKYYGSKVVLQNVTFHVCEGEAVGILGPQGAGKSTLMRILSAYIPPSEGTVTVAGYDVFTHSLQVRKRVGYLPQSVSLYSDMTVLSFLDFVASLHKLANRTRRVREVLDNLKIADQARTVIGELPQDIQQRVGIAQAIIHNPDVLLLDEPTRKLDPMQIVEIRDLIKPLRQNCTLVLGTQNLSEIEQLCDRVLILNKGRIVADDTPARLVSRLEGGQTIRLKTASASLDAISSLQALEGVKSVSPVEAGTFDIECCCDIDCRSTIANLAVQRGWGLLELQAIDSSLEKVYLELTTNSVPV